MEREICVKKISFARKILAFCSILLIFFPSILFAEGLESHMDPAASVILWVTLIFLFGIFGRFLALRFSQPGVLGELLMGVIVGNICYFFGLQLAVILREGSSVFNVIHDLLGGLPLEKAVTNSIPNSHYGKEVISALSSKDGVNLIRVAYVIDIFSRYGVIFLLFMAGLESSIEDIKNAGRESLQVAIIGVVAPMVLGFIIIYILMPESSLNAILFVSATLSATSVGITARVLKDLNKLKTHVARTILGAAMIDDILGLVILAIVSSLIIGGSINPWVISQILLVVVIFLVSVLLFGPFVLKKAVRFFKFLDPWEEKLVISFLFLMTLAYLATLAQLAMIVGAFAAGIIMHDGIFKNDKEDRKNTLTIKELVAPLEALLAPLFFVLIGIQVKIESFLDLHVIIVALGLIIAAILGKLISGLGGRIKGDRILIGIGMLPRGEVGLIFASIGKTLGVVSDELFSAIILMVIITTVIAPIWLKSRFARS